MYHTVVEYFLKSGFDVEVLLLLLSIPFIFTVINFLKYIAGIKLENPMLIIFIFVFSFLSNNMFFSTSALIVVFIFTALCYKLISRFQLHVVARTSVILSAAMIITATFVMALFTFNIDLLVRISSIDLILLLIITEELVKIIYKEGVSNATANLTRSSILGWIASLSMMLYSVQTFLLNHPFIVSINLILIILIGKYTGLRVSELMRFWNLLNETEDENTQNS